MVSGDVDANLNHVASENKAGFRDYSQKMPENRFDRVSHFYATQHANQTFQFATDMTERYSKLDKMEMSIFDAIKLLDEIVDESDPDTDSAQIVHALQTAEAARKRFPDPSQDWLWCAAFIHDLGKVLAHPKFGSQPQWAVVGDTFPVGCAYSEKCVYADTFATNPDSKNAKYSTANGVYEPNCGLEKVQMSFGHDEYMYRVCVGNKCLFPDEALYIIRYHSFYPWHSGNAYMNLCNEKDLRILPLVREFQKCDLYSKSDKSEDRPDVAKLQPFYEALIKKYFPQEKLRW